MGIKERRERQKQAIREDILAAARKIAREEGWPAVTIRRVAELIEYSPPTIYEHFTNKDAILGEIQREGFELLADALRRTSGPPGDATERVLQIGKAYWHFAQEQPELYQVMHGPDSAGLPTEATLTGGRQAAALVRESLESWAEGEGIALHHPQEAIETLWALLHGLVSVALLDRLGGGPKRAEHLAEQASRDLLFAWAARGRRQ